LVAVLNVKLPARSLTIAVGFGLPLQSLFYCCSW